jgi:hypothetical protein
LIIEDDYGTNFWCYATAKGGCDGQSRGVFFEEHPETFLACAELLHHAFSFLNDPGCTLSAVTAVILLQIKLKTM